MAFKEIFFGVAAGLVVGISVNLIVYWFINFFRERNTIKYFKYEIDINIGKINSFKNELQAYEKRVLADSLGKYFGWFYLSEIILTSINQFFYSGLIYKKFDYKDIEELQKLQKDFSHDSERYINDQVRENVTDFREQKVGTKERTLDQINFWRTKFEDHIKKLKNIKDKL